MNHVFQRKDSIIRLHGRDYCLDFASSTRMSKKEENSVLLVGISDMNLMTQIWLPLSLC
jgi:hypothetical protein